MGTCLASNIQNSGHVHTTHLSQSQTCPLNWEGTMETHRVAHVKSYLPHHKNRPCNKIWLRNRQLLQPLSSPATQRVEGPSIPLLSRHPQNLLRLYMPAQNILHSQEPRLKQCSSQWPWQEPLLNCIGCRNRDVTGITKCAAVLGNRGFVNRWRKWIVCFFLAIKLGYF